LNKLGMSCFRCNLKCATTNIARSHARFTDAFNTNVLGVINATRAILPHFRGKKSGTVVFLSSSGGMEGGARCWCVLCYKICD
jgi:NAD(P)-dependent dehydrogenase (short-subunit alcohol dehydrogenase family)